VKWLTSAPANLMVMGEHSVVYGYKAIATAIDKRLTIEWQTRKDRKIVIDSELAQYQGDLDNLIIDPKLQWVLTALAEFSGQLKYGLSIKITSQFNATLGLGSSAAVLSAMLGGLAFYLQKSWTLEDKFNIGLKIIHKIQQRGSGTDLAASLSGGMILFDPVADSSKITKLSHAPLPLNLIYCGYKTPTAEVLKIVHENWQEKPKLLTSLYKLMGQTTEQAFKAIQKNNLTDFYQLANSYQGLMDALGVNDLMLSRIIYETRTISTIQASKISGSGLGDCVLSFGNLTTTNSFINQLQPMSVQTSAVGLLCEER